MCRGAARAASVGRSRSRCVRCMCGRAACAYVGLRLGSRLWVLGICRHGLGDKKSGGVSARVGGLRARLVWEGAARGALAACAAERRALCAAGQRGGGVGAHARRINTARPRGGLLTHFDSSTREVCRSLHAHAHELEKFLTGHSAVRTTQLTFCSLSARPKPSVSIRRYGERHAWAPSR